MDVNELLGLALTERSSYTAEQTAAINELVEWGQRRKQTIRDALAADPPDYRLVVAKASFSLNSYDGEIAQVVVNDRSVGEICRREGTEGWFTGGKPSFFGAAGIPQDQAVMRVLEEWLSDLFAAQGI